MLDDKLSLVSAAVGFTWCTSTEKTKKKEAKNEIIIKFG